MPHKDRSERLSASKVVAHGEVLATVLGTALLEAREVNRVALE